VLAFWISIHGLVALLGAEVNATTQRRQHRAGTTATPAAPALANRQSS